MVSAIKGINSIGFDILPTSQIAVDAKKSMFQYDIEELRKLLNDIRTIAIPNSYKRKVNSIKITDFAYPKRPILTLHF